MYQGEYNDSKKHEPDLDDVLDRSLRHGLRKLIVTGGTLEDSKKALDLAKQKGKSLMTLVFTSQGSLFQALLRFKNKIGAKALWRTPKKDPN